MLDEFGILTYSVQLDSVKCVKATFECITHCEAYVWMNILTMEHKKARITRITQVSTAANFCILDTFITFHWTA